MSQPPDFVHASEQSVTPDTNKQSLVALLPSEQDATTIVTNTTAWLWGLETPLGNVMTPKVTLQLLQTAEISKGSAMHVAKTLLLFALYMQQLPASHDDVKFFGYKGIESAISMITERVRLFLLSHEDEDFPVMGLEALILLSLIHLNECSIRKAWILFRRALDLARLKGFHTSYSASERDSPSSERALHRSLWLSSVCGDCYCSILLGLEAGAGSSPYGLDDLERWNDPFTEDDADVQRNISLIVTQIARRNAVGPSHDLRKLRELDEALNHLQDSLPSSWWRTPMLRQDRPLESAKEPNRIICQLWLLQARMYVHMPIAFGKDFDDDALNSLESCMEAARNTLQRHTGLQHARDYLSRCRSVDQAVVVAAVVLLLAKAQLQSHRKSRARPTRTYHDADLALLEQVIESFDAVGRTCRREHVARKSVEILSSMMKIAASEESKGEHASRDLASTINTPVEVEVPGSEPNISVVGSGLVMTRFGLEDIIVSSILPTLDERSPANRIIKTWLAGTSVPVRTQETSQRNTDITFDDFIDSNIFLSDNEHKSTAHQDNKEQILY